MHIAAISGSPSQHSRSTWVLHLAKARLRDQAHAHFTRFIRMGELRHRAGHRGPRGAGPPHGHPAGAALAARHGGYPHLQGFLQRPTQALPGCPVTGRSARQDGAAAGDGRQLRAPASTRLRI